MSKSTASYNPCCTYPGEYTPLPDIIGWQLRIEGQQDDPAAQPVDTAEFDDHFILRVPLAGHHREDILVYVHDGVISLVITDGHTEDAMARQRHIRLPGHIATGFVSASYQSGLLTIHVPKSTAAADIQSQEVAVY